MIFSYKKEIFCDRCHRNDHKKSECKSSTYETGEKIQYYCNICNKFYYQDPCSSHSFLCVII